ncbi:MAG: AMP-binding protein [Caldisphaeraceae archaeon]|nr:AMP-binding protein [Caldisphaeraceae archaeon]
MFRDYQLTIDKILNYSLFIAPKQKIIYSPPGHRKVEYTYKEFVARINKLGNILEMLGAKRASKAWEMGTRVAIMDWNSSRYLELLYAVSMYGAVAYSVNIRLAPEEIIYTMNVAEPETLFIYTDFIPYLKIIVDNVKSLRNIVIMSDESTCEGRKYPIDEIRSKLGKLDVYEYEELLESPKKTYAWPELDERVVAGMFFTSGTTGRPKGVYHTHRQMLLSSLQILIALMEYPSRVSNRDTTLMLTPFFHIFGWMSPYYNILVGNKVILPGRYKWDHIALLVRDLIPETKKVGGRVIAMGVPTMLYSIIQEAKKAGVKNLSGFVFGYGGEALPISVYEEAKSMNIDIITGYGPSETLTAITRIIYIPRLWMEMGLDDNTLRDHFVKNNSLGVPIPLNLIKAVDDKGDEVPQDGKTPGKILLYAPSLTREYYKDLEKTERAWRYGYFDVDDIVTIDPYGCVIFIDREKDAIKSGGEWIPSSRLEGFISRHPAIAEVAVIAAPHEKWVERPVAIAVPHSEYKDKVTENEVKEFLLKEFVEKGLMPKWWIPDRVIFVNELPKTSTEKINKRAIRERLEEYLSPS